MGYAIHITVNTSDKEFDYDFASAHSLDTAMQVMRELHPDCTSVLMAIVPIASEASEGSTST